ncbi:MAG: phospholipase D family protein [Methylococcales bacterium]|nr:phospholipase D family protein [Methylococcales bacterium]
MKILDSSACLGDYLKSHKQKHIRIVTAFASGTEPILSILLDNANTIELLVGTINAFTSPKFIEYCAKHDSEKLKAFVDFGYQSSIHWKLYLISPNIVVIGSSNFTSTGIALTRDTCLVVKNTDLYCNYEKHFQELLERPNVISVKSQQFESAFNTYCVNHDRTQAGMARSRHYSTLEEWLSDETNQRLPLFIWDVKHTAETKAEATRLLQENSAEGDVPTLRDFFTYKAKKNELPFRQGDVVLCASNRGDYLGFYTFDRIIYSKQCHFIYSYRRSQYQHPFDLNGLKKKLKRAIPDIFDREATHIDRDELQSILFRA